MILHLDRFVATERPYWDELERMLTRMEAEPDYRPALGEVERFHYLYQRAAADLGKMATAFAEPETQKYLEGLVARAYAEINETRDQRLHFHPWRWFTYDFPRTFRAHRRAWQLSVAATILGCLFGAVALRIDPEAKGVLLPFGHLLGDPSERVKKEEAAAEDRLAGHKSTFAGQLMTHNTQVAIFTMGLGVTFGVGTVLELFYNGVILGAVSLDYIQAGQTRFLLGWLLPHGATEIPAILLGGQAGLVLAGALIGWGDRRSRRERLRVIGPDLVTIIGGAGVLLIWAGIVESFFSQYHEPVLPYALKIAFGAVELTMLFSFLALAGRRERAAKA